MRRLIQILFLAAALVAIAAAALPWWLDTALRPLARAQGATYARYERLGYGRLRLHDVEFNRGPVRISVDRLETSTPLAWLFPANRRVAVTDWKVVATPSPKSIPETEGKLQSMPALYSLLQQVTSALARWLPAATVGRGEVQWPGQTLSLQQAEWKNRILKVQALAWHDFSGDVTSSWPAQGPVAVEINASEGNLRFTWAEGAVKGAGVVWDQPLQFTTQFPADRWMPESAGITAADWTLPAARLKLGPDYATVHGHAHVAWSHDHFIVSAQGKAAPREDAASVPPFEAELEARGDMHGVTVTALHVAAPFATADLSAPVTLDFAKGFQAGSAQLSVQADLAKQPWFPARGRVDGVIGVSGAGAQSFTLACDGLQVRDFSLLRATARGTLQWPRLDLAELDLQLDASSRVTSHGGIDLVTRELSAGTLQADVAGNWFARWIPASVRWRTANITATFSGPWAAPEHAGRITVAGVDLPPLKIMDVEATWRGRGPALEEFSVQAASGGARLTASGALEANQLQLRALTLERADKAALTLAAPARAAWSPELSVEPLRLVHDNTLLFAEWTGGWDGHCGIEAANVDSSWVRDWMAVPGPDWRISALRFDGALTEGKLTFATQLNAHIALSPQPADLRLRAHGDAQGVQLDELSTTLGERVVTQASGKIPMTWDAKAAPHLQVDWKAPLEITAHTTPDSPLWAMLGDWGGVTVENPVAEVRLGGTLDRPTGELRVKTARLSLARGGFKESIPEVTDFVLEARADSDGLTIDTFSARIDEQSIQARGKLPARRADWASLRQDPLAFVWQHGEGHIDLADADLARLAKRAPKFMAPQGRLSARLDLASGGALSGELHLKGAALRPIDPLGTVQEINADLALVDRRLEIQNWSAKLGGEPVELRGTIELPPQGQPRVALTLQGKNLPLVRRTGLIVRCDLDLAAKTGGNDVTQVTGVVLLHDSVVLADLSVLRPSGQTTARRQPPYFSVEVDPFRDWVLGVNLRGSRAISIRTPVFIGVASARFRLEGTLGEPRAIGELTVDEGRVLFPFATFTVQFGAVRLSEADPYHPQLTVSAQSRYHDYLLHLEASGPLASPHIQLTSNPALEAAELLLMVTSGQSPESDQAAASGTQRLARLGTYLGQGLILGSGGEANRIELTSGSRVSRQGRETYEFTYRLDERWSLVGEYDEYDEYNAGVKWRAYVQEGDANAKK